RMSRPARTSGITRICTEVGWAYWRSARARTSSGVSPREANVMRLGFLRAGLAAHSGANPVKAGMAGLFDGRGRWTLQDGETDELTGRQLRRAAYCTDFPRDSYCFLAPNGSGAGPQICLARDPPSAADAVSSARRRSSSV